MTTTAIDRGHVPIRRLWFGFAGAAAAWILLGIADLLIAWQACQGGQHGWGLLSQNGVVTLFFTITLLLLVTAVWAAAVAYGSWKRTASTARLADSEAVGREEFMSIVGMFVGVSFIVGILWLGLPLAIIDICARAR